MRFFIELNPTTFPRAKIKNRTESEVPTLRKLWPRSRIFRIKLRLTAIKSSTSSFNK